MREGETTAGREGSRGNGAKGGGKPPPLALSRPIFPLPSFCPSSVPPPSSFHPLLSYNRLHE